MSPSYDGTANKLIRFYLRVSAATILEMAVVGAFESPLPADIIWLAMVADPEEMFDIGVEVADEHEAIEMKLRWDGE